MLVVRTTGSASLWCALLLVGCPGSTPQCPEATVTTDPVEIPPGNSETDLFVDVSNPIPENGLEVITELTSISGTIRDPFALETTFRCDHDVSGEVEICVHATYAGADGADGGMPEAGVSLALRGEDPNVGASYQYVSKPHVRLSDPLECSETQCRTIICPEEQNTCPVVSSLTVEPSPPTVVPDGGTATIEVVAEDPDDGPEALVTTLSAQFGTITDPTALTATYACDSDVGGIIEICVVANDGDCDDMLCTGVRCPGVPHQNTCPTIDNFTATPNPVAPGTGETTVRFDAVDPDEYPEPLTTELSSATGVFEDSSASETTFHCRELGPVEIFVDATDGECDQQDSLVVECPSVNLCPNLKTISKVDPNPGEITALVQTRATETDSFPFPIKLTLRALWGSFENTENIVCPPGATSPECVGFDNDVRQDATYICVLPGRVEVCVDATDGDPGCTKTSCTDVICPDDI